MGKNTGLYACPSCSRSVVFRSETTRLIICSCGVVLHRLESDDLVIKPNFIVPDSNDLIQKGSKGTFEGQRFEVLGRFRLWLDASVINYWTIFFEDGSTALLSEGYGLYRVLRRITVDINLSAGDMTQYKLTEPLTLVYPDTYYIKSKDECWKYDIEGEVFLPECNDIFPVFDCYAEKGKFIEMMEFLRGYLVAFSATHTSFNELELEDLNTKEPKSKEIACPQCREQVIIKTFPYAQSCSCMHCGARMTLAKDGRFRSISHDKHNQNNLSLPLGSKGEIKGIPYEIIGYAQKQDDTPYRSFWKEYVLYNREEGYAFLSEYGGNWIYVRENNDCPVRKEDKDFSLDHDGRNYQLYNDYGYKVVDTAGEFPYDIFDEKLIHTAEFISPPFMWTYERCRNERIDWFFGQHISRSELLSQFPFDIPDQTESDHLEPGGYVDTDQMVKITLIAVLALTLIHIIITLTQSNKVVDTNSIQFKDSAGAATYVSGKFKLTKWRSNLEFDIWSSVDNSWIDLDLTLVDNATGTEQSVDQLVEYYHGYEDGETWTEGSATESAYLSGIPPGTYFLRIDATRDVTSNSGSGNGLLTVTTKNDVPIHRNYLICLALLLLWPIATYYWRRARDRDRWDNSPYSPYND